MSLEQQYGFEKAYELSECVSNIVHSLGVISYSVEKLFEIIKNPQGSLEIQKDLMLQELQNRVTALEGKND